MQLSIDCNCQMAYLHTTIRRLHNWCASFSSCQYPGLLAWLFKRLIQHVPRTNVGGVLNASSLTRCRKLKKGRARIIYFNASHMKHVRYCMLPHSLSFATATSDGEMYVYPCRRSPLLEAPFESRLSCIACPHSIHIPSSSVYNSPSPSIPTYLSFCFISFNLPLLSPHPLVIIFRHSYAIN